MPKAICLMGLNEKLKLRELFPLLKTSSAIELIFSFSSA
jgi:hypothetical protein